MLSKNPDCRKRFQCMLIGYFDYDGIDIEKTFDEYCFHVF
jgi:hypothetical protein